MMGWTSRNQTWANLGPSQKAAAMALMEADRRNPVDAKNALGAMINRAAKSGQDLGNHVSGKIYQPTIEPSQEGRLNSILQSPLHAELTAWADRRQQGMEQDPVGGATHFLAPGPQMERLERGNPSKYYSWGNGGRDGRGWTGYNRETKQYRGQVMADGSHAFLAPEGQYSVPYKGMDERPQSAAFSNVPQNREGQITTAPIATQPQPSTAASPVLTAAASQPTWERKQPYTNAQTGATMTPTPGREAVLLNGKSPEEQRDALQGAYDRGNKNMLYVHDDNPRVIARPGDAKWMPDNGGLTTGPTFANSFLASNADYKATPLPMPSDNPLKGSRYDDGTATGTLPAQPTTPPPALQGPPSSIAAPAMAAPAKTAPTPDAPAVATASVAAPPADKTAAQPPSAAQPTAPQPPEPKQPAATQIADSSAPSNSILAPSRRMGLGVTETPTVLEQVPKKPGLKGPDQYPQWNLNPANPGVSWASGGFSSFGAG